MSGISPIGARFVEFATGMKRAYEHLDTAFMCARKADNVFTANPALHRANADRALGAAIRDGKKAIALLDVVPMQHTGNLRTSQQSAQEAVKSFRAIVGQTFVDGSKGLSDVYVTDMERLKKHINETWAAVHLA